jgi:hypothetical protein
MKQYKKELHERSMKMNGNFCIAMCHYVTQRLRRWSFDGVGLSAFFCFILSVTFTSAAMANTQPVANAGVDHIEPTSSYDTLLGGLSKDPDGDAITYRWTQIGGSPVYVNYAKTSVAIYYTPTVEGPLVFQLIVNDGTLDSLPDTATVIVSNSIPDITVSPVAKAGPDQRVRRASQVTLDGSQSTDPDSSITSYHWSQIAGPAVSLSNSSAVSSSFAAPASDTVLVFSLVVSDGVHVSLADTVTVLVINEPPLIESLVIVPGEAYTTDTLSVDAVISDPDGDSLTTAYVWSKNGVPIPDQTGPTLGPDQFVKHDVISVDITVADNEFSVSRSANVEILDSPPVISGVIPSTATYGVPLTFQVSAIDVDDDPISFRRYYGPAGLQVDAQGLVTWTPTGPMFDTQVTMNMGIEAVALGLTDALEGSTVVSDLNRQKPLVRTGFQVPKNQYSITTGDFDGDGKNEILATDNYRALYTLEYNGTDYVQDWVYPFDLAKGEAISSITTGRIDADEFAEIIVGGGDGITVLDGRSKSFTGSITDGMREHHAVHVVDLDNDGVKEIVYLGNNYSYEFTVFVFDAITLQEKWHSEVLDYGDSMAIGNVDSDAALEIVTSGGYVIDGASFIQEWACPDRFGGLVDIGDVDGDGINEIIGVSSNLSATSPGIRAYNAVTQSLVWELATGYSSGALEVRNIDSDPEAEILIGESRPSYSVTAYSFDRASGTLVEDWTIGSQWNFVNAVTAGDVDGDGKPEFIWTNGAYVGAEDYLVVGGLNPDPNAKGGGWKSKIDYIGVEWINTNPAQLDGPFVGARWLTLAPDTQRAVFLSPRTNGSYDGSRLIHISSDGEVNISAELDTNWADIRAMDGDDFDGDGVDEVVYATADYYTGYFAARDVLSDTEEWASPFDVGNARAIAHGDLTGDGYSDFVMLSLVNFSDIFAYDLKTQTLLWHGQDTGSYGVDVAVHDLDGDGVREIIVIYGPPGYNDSSIKVFEKIATGYQLRSETVIPSTASSMAVGDLNDDGIPEIAIGSRDYYGSKVTVLNNELRTIFSFDQAGYITELQIHDAPFGPKNLIIGVDDNQFTARATKLIVLDPFNGKDIWHTPSLVGKVQPNSLEYADTDGDGTREIVFGTSDAMYITR